MMDKFLTKGGLAIASMMLFALPAFPSTLSFTFTTGSEGTASLSGSSGSYALSAMTLNVQSWTDTYAGGAQTGPLSGATLVLASTTGGVDTFDLNTTGTIDGDTGTLLSFKTTAATVNTSGSLVDFGAGTTLVSVQSSFATTTGINASSTVTLGNDYFDLSAPTSGTVTSAVLSTTFTATPEPASFALFGIGLIGAAIAARRRRAVQPAA